MTNFLAQVHEAYQSPCADFLLDRYRAMEQLALKDLGIPLPAWQGDEAFLEHLFSSPLAGKLAGIAQAAAQTLDRTDLEVWQKVHDDLNQVLSSMFTVPGAESPAYRVPKEFWSSPIGQMFALARIWLAGDCLISISEAARLAGVPLSTMASRVARGVIQSFPDPSAANPQKAARLVLREDSTK